MQSPQRWSIPPSVAKGTPHTVQRGEPIGFARARQAGQR